MFFGKSNLVSAFNYTYTPTQFWTSQTANGEIENFNPGTLISNGFNSGDSAFVIAYGESIITNTYADSSSGKPVFPNINSLSPSNVVGFIIP